MKMKVTANRIKYATKVEGDKAVEYRRLIAAAAVVTGDALATGMRMHEDSTRLQTSLYWEIEDAEGGTYSVCVKATKLSQAEKLTRTKAAAAAAAAYATWLIGLADKPEHMARAAAAAVELQTKYIEHLLSRGEGTAVEFFDKASKK